jgi:YidC/Oxa1 family membrane protein insertase
VDKRFLIFLVSAIAIFWLNMWIVQQINPPPERPVVEKKKDDKTGEQKAAKTKTAAPAKTEKTSPKDSPKEAPKEDPPVVVAAPTVPLSITTLGSLDPASPYRLLVTLSNAGASLVRAELNNPRYGDLEVRLGYLGALAPSDAPDGGCRIGIVGAGTPAASAGLQAGDVITAVNDEKVASAADFVAHMAETEPRRSVTLSVRRAGANLTVSADLIPYPLAVVRPDGENYTIRGEEVPEGLEPSLLMTLAQVGKDKLGEKVELAGVDLRSANWEVGLRDDQGKWTAGGNKDHRVTYRRSLPQRNLVVYKTFELATVPHDQHEEDDFPAYHLTLSLDIENTATVDTEIAYQLDGPNGLPTEGWWYAYKISRNWGGAGLRDYLVAGSTGGTPKLFTAATVSEAVKEENTKKTKGTFGFLAVDAQYFSAVMRLANESAEEAEFEKIGYRVAGPVHEEDGRLSNVSFRIESSAVELPAGESLTHQFQVFLGPKQPDLVARDEYQLSELIYYGWFKWVAKPMLSLLHVFYFFVRNYGVAIIMLTILVRSCMFPISKKQARNAQKMQELQPEIKKIKERYPKDMEKQMKAQRELFRKNKYNPMAGCLPVFFQMPIFIGLYRSLSVDIELRQAPLFSSAIRPFSNLAAPDRLFDWASFMPDFVTTGQGMLVLGPYFNLLPILTITIWIVQQKMFMPPATDDQTAMQQKIMKYMMVFMGFMFYKVAAGLCLYFMASSLWSIAERKLLPKPKPATAATTTPAKPAEKKKPTNNTGGGSSKKKKKKKRRK